MASLSRSALFLLVVFAISFNFSVSMAATRNLTTAECQNFITTSLIGCSSVLSSTSSVAPDNTSCCQPVEKAITNATEFNCICSLASQSEYTATITKALTIPKACNLPQTVTMSNCTGSSANSTSSTASNSTAAGSSAYGLRAPGFLSIFGVVVLSFIFKQ